MFSIPLRASVLCDLCELCVKLASAEKKFHAKLAKTEGQKLTKDELSWLLCI